MPPKQKLNEPKMSKQQISKGTSLSQMTRISKKPKPRVRKCDNKNPEQKAK